MKIDGAKNYPREFDLSDILKTSWVFFAGRLKLTFLIAAIVEMPVAIYYEMLPDFKGGFFNLDMTSFSIICFVQIYSIYSTIAIALLIDKSRKAENVSFLEVLIQTFKVFPKVAGTFALTLLFAFPGMITLLSGELLPEFWADFNPYAIYALAFPLLGLGVIFLNYSYFSLYASAFSSRSFFSGIVYSISLVKGRFWKTATVHIGIIFLWAVSIVLFFLIRESIPSFALRDMIFSIITALPLSYFSVARAVFFFNYDDTSLLK